MSCSPTETNRHARDLLDDAEHATAIRAVPRVGLIILLAWAAGLALAVDGTARRMPWAALVLALVCLVEQGISLAALAADAGLASSRSDARRLAQGGGLRLNDEPVLDAAKLVTLKDLREGAIKLAAERAHVIAEGAAGCAVAAALTGHAGAGKVVAVLSGGNIDLPRFAEITAAQTPAV